MDQVNERGTWISTVDFKDQNGDPVTPSSALYRIEDVGSSTVLRGNTAIAPLSDSVEIVWDESDTLILDSVNPYETRKMTVWYEWAAGQNSEQYFLNVKNLGGITATSPA